MRCFPILFLVVLTASCSTSAYHTATPIPKGTNELGAFAGGVFVTPAPNFFGGSESSPERSEVLPQFDLTYRRGLTAWSDAGVQVGMGTLQLDFNVALVNTENFALSLDPQIQTFVLVPIRTRLGIYADVLKTTNGAILSLNVAPGFRFDEGPVVGAGILAKLPMGSAFFSIFVDGEVILGHSESNLEITHKIFAGGIGVTYGF